MFTKTIVTFHSLTRAVSLHFQLENIETFVADIHQGNTSPTLLHNLIDKLNESRILGIPDQKIAEARELANTLAPEMVSAV